MAETELVPSPDTRETSEVRITAEEIAQTAETLSQGKGIINELDEVPGLVLARRMLDEKGRDPLIRSTVEDLREGRTK